MRFIQLKVHKYNYHQLKASKLARFPYESLNLCMRTFVSLQKSIKQKQWRPFGAGFLSSHKKNNEIKIEKNSKKTLNFIEQSYCPHGSHVKLHKKKLPVLFAQGITKFTY